MDTKAKRKRIDVSETAKKLGFEGPFYVTAAAYHAAIDGDGEVNAKELERRTWNMLSMLQGEFARAAKSPGLDGSNPLYFGVWAPVGTDVELKALHERHADGSETTTIMLKDEE